MQFNLTEQEIGLIFQALAELPFKVSAPLLQNIENQFKAIKEAGASPAPEGEKE